MTFAKFCEEVSDIQLKRHQKCAHELCKYWNKERGSCFFFVEGSGEVEDMPCYKEKEEFK